MLLVLHAKMTPYNKQSSIAITLIATDQQQHSTS